jgi:hypothetical protein
MIYHHSIVKETNSGESIVHENAEEQEEFRLFVLS